MRIIDLTHRPATIEKTVNVGLGMSENNTAMLSERIHSLIELVQTLDEQNRHLQSQNTRLKEERAQLLTTHEGTRGRVESMLTRLKALEKNL